MNKTLSLKETKKDLIKILELPKNDFAMAEISEEENGIRVEFKFNMRNVVSNPMFFRNVPAVIEKYGAYVALEPREPKRDGPYIELLVAMKVGEVTP